MTYIEAHVINVGQWQFYPEAMGAFNIHNGTWIQFRNTNRGWTATCVNCPTDRMFEEIVQWFYKWINNR